MKEFFVYVLLDPRKKENVSLTIRGTVFNFQYKPFYIGKGKGDRIQQHYRKYNLNKNTEKNNVILKIINGGMLPISIKIFDCLDEDIAYDIEKEAISIVGLNNLTNKTDGGIGQCSSSMIGEKNPMFGKHPVPWNKGTKGVVKSNFKGMKLEEILGDEKAQNVKKKQSLKRKNKSWEEYFGEDRAKEVRKERSEKMMGYKHKKETIIKMKNSSTPEIITARRNLTMIKKQKKFDFDMQKHETQIIDYIRKGFNDNEIILRIPSISKYRLKKMLFLKRNNLNSSYFFKLNYQNNIKFKTIN